MAAAAAVVAAIAAAAGWSPLGVWRQDVSQAGWMLGRAVEPLNRQDVEGFFI